MWYFLRPMFRQKNSPWLISNFGYYFFAKLYDSKNERKACYFNFFHECLTKFTADRSKTRKDSFLKVNTPEPIVLNNLGNINMLLKNQWCKNANNYTKGFVYSKYTERKCAKFNFIFKDQQFLSIDEYKIMKIWQQGFMSWGPTFGV